ncbi:MAG: aspartyl protease family protein [Chthoniobacterales bacterium]
MGEVRVKVKLTNLIEESLARRGLLDPGTVHSIEADALVDTGATRGIIPREVADALHLDLDGETVATYADGRTGVVPRTDPVRVEVMGRDAVEEVIVLGDEVVIGQLVLEAMDLRVDCKNQQVIPNPKHPDGPAFRV